MRTFTYLFTISALAVASSAIAQPREVKVKSSGETRAIPENLQGGSDTGKGQEVNIEFKGGTLSEFVALLTQTTDPRINLAVAPEILKARIPELTLRKITVPNALLAALTAADDPAKHFWIVETGEGLNPLYRISSRNGPQSPRPQAESSLQVFPLKEWAGTPEITLSAVESAVSLLGGSEPPKVAFHKDSGLLMVSGTAATIDTVKKVLDGLEERANAAKVQLDRSIAINLLNTIKAPSEKQALEILLAWKGKAEDYDRAMADNAIRNATNQEKLDIIRREVEEVRKRADERIIALDRELLLSKASNSNTMTELNAQRAENQRLKAELEALRAKVAGPAAEPGQPK